MTSESLRGICIIDLIDANVVCEASDVDYYGPDDAKECTAEHSVACSCCV